MPNNPVLKPFKTRVSMGLIALTGLIPINNGM